MDRTHWERAYEEKSDDEVSWFQPDPETSLAMIARTELDPDDPVIDVGGGASRLVDRLLERGHRDVRVLDIAEAPLARARGRLGVDADRVRWIRADVTSASLEPVQLWHDRAVFHFLVAPESREAYRRVLLDTLVPGGTLVLGTFAPDGPERCSGLPVERYDLPKLCEVLGDELEPIEELRETHVTPAGREQRFFFARFRRV